MLDLQRCIFTRVDEGSVAVGSTVSAEGRILVAALGTDGEEYLTESGGVSATEKFAGISYNTALTPTKYPNVETGTIPAVAPYTIQLVKTALVSGQIRVYASTTGELANDTGVHPTTPDAGKFSVNYTTGLVYFNAAQLSEDVTIYYQYSPTTLEAQMRFWEAGINVNSGGTFNQIGAIKAPCIIYTSEYDASVNWATNVTIKTGANGRFEGTGGSGYPLATARVVHVPDADNVFLGVEFLVL
jgi:hypothetical protein